MQIVGEGGTAAHRKAAVAAVGEAAMPTAAAAAVEQVGASTLAHVVVPAVGATTLLLLHPLELREVLMTLLAAAAGATTDLQAGAPLLTA